MALANGNRIITLRTADGKNAAVRAVRASAAGDRFVLGRTADGKRAALKVAPVNAEGQRGFPARCADGERALVKMLTGGVIWAWGYNNVRQLGDGTTTQREEPVPIVAVPALVMQVVDGESHAIALLADGSIWAWGNNTHGRLGIGIDLGGAYDPQQAGDETTPAFKFITVGHDHSVGIAIDGSIWAWGNHQEGMLGIWGVTDNVNIPTPMTTDKTFVKANAEGYHRTMAIDVDGQLWVCGLGGLFGTGAHRHGVFFDVIAVDKTAKTFTIAGDWVAQWNTVGYFQVYDSTANNRGFRLSDVQLVSGNTVLTTTYTVYSDIADGKVRPYSVCPVLFPVAVGLGYDVIAAACGNYWYVFVTSDGNVYSCGENAFGQLGIGNTTEQWEPVQVIGEHTFMEVACGWSHCVALTNDGKIYTWGRNNFGQLGDGTIIDKHTPTHINAFGGKAIIDIAAGKEHSVVIDEDGVTWAWGANYYGQLGDGTTAQKTTPVQVSGGHVFLSVTAGGRHTHAIAP